MQIITLGELLLITLIGFVCVILFAFIKTLFETLKNK